MAIPILNAHSLGKRYGERSLFEDVKLSLAPGERAGLVGDNGSGKSTLARVLAGWEEPDTGEVVTARGARLLYLSQEPDLPAEMSAREVVLSGLERWSQAVARHEQLNSAIASGAGDSRALLAEQAEVAAEVERLGGWDQAHKAEAMLGYLGIERPDQPIGPMSGGERRRVAMARLLIAEPDIAIMDEPTNHMDIDTIEWLESYLCERFRGALLLITHDRYLLDRVVTRTYEIDEARVYGYPGGWAAYLSAKAEREAHDERVYKNRENIMRRELQWLGRQPKARSTKQKARIGRAEQLMAETEKASDRAISFLVQKAHAGQRVLEVEDLAVEVAGRRLLEGLTVSLGHGERIGIVGPNGCGKTSLLRVLLGQNQPAHGKVLLGKHTKVAYLDQQRSGLDPDKTVFESVANGRSHVRLGDNDVSVYAYLERFLFSPRAQKQQIATLSGGERARVALANLLCDRSNLVVLDEPTNDLDVTTLSALEDALSSFQGTVLCVTHDRFFLDRVATSILAFERAEHEQPGPQPPQPGLQSGPMRAVHVYGNYQRYLDYRAARALEQASEASRKNPPKPAARADASAPPAVNRSESGTDDGKSAGRRKLTYGEEIELDTLPERIEATEAAVALLEAEMNAPAFQARDHVQQASFFERLSAAKSEADALVERWADLESRRADE